MLYFMLFIPDSDSTTLNVAAEIEIKPGNIFPIVSSPLLMSPYKL